MKRPTRWLLSTDAFDLAEKNTADTLLKVLALNQIKASEIDLAAGLDPLHLGSLTQWLNVFRTIQGHEIWTEHGEWVQQNQPVFGPGIKERFGMASKITDANKNECIAKREVISEHVLNILSDDGILIIPTTPGPAPLLNTPPETLETWRANLLSLTCIGGLVGLPQVTIPIFLANGLPVGLSLIGPRGSDEELLEASIQIKIMCG